MYDVSSWSDHPGGNVIFTTVGEDGEWQIHPGSGISLREEEASSMFWSIATVFCRIL